MKAIWINDGDENQFLRKQGIISLCDHEIGTHYYRAFNDGKSCIFMYFCQNIQGSEKNCGWFSSFLGVPFLRAKFSLFWVRLVKIRYHEHFTC